LRGKGYRKLQAVSFPSPEGIACRHVESKSGGIGAILKVWGVCGKVGVQPAISKDMGGIAAICRIFIDMTENVNLDKAPDCPRFLKVSISASVHVYHYWDETA
jgi:hypothetical protein